MVTRTMTVRSHLREIGTVLTYIIAAAAIGTGLALASEVHAAPAISREG